MAVLSKWDKTVLVAKSAKQGKCFTGSPSQPVQRRDGLIYKRHLGVTSLIIIAFACHQTSFNMPMDIKLIYCYFKKIICSLLFSFFSSFSFPGGTNFVSKPSAQTEQLPPLVQTRPSYWPHLTSCQKCWPAPVRVFLETVIVFRG